ncbi:MAG: GNAT family N-acetyltransferase [Dehalococcoidia bacterium]|nr:GNAT family N-acetyltransferase [Dehalococcoidia bacterium]
MPSTIRRATKADAGQISEIIAELIREPDPVALAGTRTPQEIEEWMDRQGDHGAFFVVEDDRGRLLGFATVDFNSAEPDAATFGAWIRQQNRRQGHGTALAEYSLAFARQQGYGRIKARLPRDNQPALSYLSSIGALVPLFNPGTTFELPIYQEGERNGGDE